MKIKVFNADDHPLLLKGVSDFLRATEEIEWVGSASDGKEAIDKIRSIQPDLALLDIEMPYFTGMEVMQQLLEEGIKTKFVLLTLFKDEALFRQALKLGAKGYLLKESGENEILNCIRLVNSGKSYVSPSLTQYLITEQSENKQLRKLSEHEINILKLIARQKTTAEIARMLFISPKTVSNHRANISKKLELVGEQNGLLKWAIAHQNILKD